jgi:hypothetical protein
VKTIVVLLAFLPAAQGEPNAHWFEMGKINDDGTLGPSLPAFSCAMNYGPHWECSVGIQWSAVDGLHPFATKAPLPPGDAR